jgi:hypothetical protein
LRKGSAATTPEFGAESGEQAAVSLPERQSPAYRDAEVLNKVLKSDNG